MGTRKVNNVCNVLFCERFDWGWCLASVIRADRLYKILSSLGGEFGVAALRLFAIYSVKCPALLALASNYLSSQLNLSS